MSEKFDLDSLIAWIADKRSAACEITISPMPEGNKVQLHITVWLVKPINNSAGLRGEDTFRGVQSWEDIATGVRCVCEDLAEAFPFLKSRGPST